MTDRYKFAYDSHATFAYQTMHTVIDQMAHDTVTTEYHYTRFHLPAIMRSVPTPQYTALTQTVTSGAGVTTVQDIYYGAQTGTSSVSGWGSTFDASTSALGTPFLILDTATRVTVNGIEKAYQSTAYTLDTARTYGGDAALTALLGLDLKQKVARVLNPATHAVRTAQTTDYQNLRYIDTVGTEVYAFLQKLVVWARWDSLKRNGLIDPTIKWEEAMFDPRIAVWNYDTVTTRVLVPPQYRLQQATALRDGSGTYLQGTGSLLQSAFDPVWDSSYANRGLPLIDTVIGAGGSARIIAARHGYSNRLPSGLVDANGSMKRMSYDYGFPENTDPATGIFPYPHGKILDDRDSVSDYEMRGAIYGNLTEQPLAERSYVRRYIPGTGTIDTLTFEQTSERSYYGLSSGSVDANGWYTRAAYDPNGRLNHLWMPGDFQSPDSVYSIDYSGWDSSEAYGSTTYGRFAGYAVCNIDKPGFPDTLTSITNWFSLYADDPIPDIPACPACGETSEKGSGRSIQATCDDPIYFVVPTAAVGGASFRVLPPEVASILSLDSAYLKLDITSVVGECVTLKVTVPSLEITKYFVFNCDHSEDGIGGGGGTGSGTKEKARGRTVQSGDTTTVSDATSLKIDLTSKTSAILAMQGEYLGATVEVTTPGGRVEFASGFDAEDVRPELMLKGSFRKVNHLADYTLAYTYSDGDLSSTAEAKVDDIRHTANMYDSVAVGDCRRTSATHRFGADGRILQSERKIVEDSGAVVRVDTSVFAYTGLPRRTQAKDPEGDTVATHYDALGRATEIVNADGTHSTVAYTYGSESDLGVSDQDFYGFVMAKTTTNENGTRFTQFTDAFGQLRREVADSGSTGSSSTHMNFTTRYEYDLQGRLTRVVNPKGDTTRYAYDDFGRVEYKNQPDLGTISYAYDNAGNVRFSQSAEQAAGGRVAFSEYDDMNRVTVIGEAVLGGTSFNEDTMLVASGGSGTFPPTGRLTSSLDPTRLHTGASSSILTANRTLWSTPAVAVPAFNPNFGINTTCTLPPNTNLGETSAPVLPFIRRPASYWYSNPPIASCDTNSFEHISQHPEFVRIVVAYDTIPASQGAAWQAFPAKWQWNQLAPHGVVRNTKGHEVATAYRERGCEPFHYTVMSYDERGRVEALMRWNENLGFDAVYYTYSSMNQVTSVRVVDPLRQYTTWYGYDNVGRVDSVWSKLNASGSGLSTITGFRYVTAPARPDTADIVYRYTKTGQLATMQYPPVNVLVTYAYDHRKWLDSLVSTQSGSPLFREILSYDPSGQITKQIWRHGTSTRQEQQYSYDSLQRLVGWTQGPAGGTPTGTMSYSYDNAGNRLGVTTGSTTLEQYTITTGKNRLESHRLTPALGFPIRSDYGYNANGSGVRRDQSEDHGLFLTWQQTENYGYSFRELMKRYKVATPGSLGTIVTRDWRYRYSAGGEREQKRMYPDQWGDTDVVYPWVYYALGANKEQLAVYHGQQLVNMYCAGDTGRRVYFYPDQYITNGVGYTGAPEQLAQVITKPSGTKEYRVSDHLASLRVAIEGGTTRTLNYDPWGNPLSGSATGERSTFNDQEKDLENGLFDLSDRNYDAKTGAFTKPDRLLEKFPSVSPYAYCSDNPVRLTDPDGMQVRSSVIVPYGKESGGESAGNNTAVAAAQAYIIHRGYADCKASTLRQEYINRVSGLTTDESALRKEIKYIVREQSPAEYRAIAESIRPASAEGMRMGGTANKTNAAINELMPKIGVAGKVMVGVGVAMSVYHVATADDKPRAAAQEAGGWAGALAGGEVGAEVGASVGACFGGVGAVPGAIIGGIVGSIAGGIAGSELGDKTYESVTGK